MLLDLMHGKLDEIFVDFGSQRTAQSVRIGLPQHAKGPWRRDQDQRLRLPGIHRGIEAIGLTVNAPAASSAARRTSSPTITL